MRKMLLTTAAAALIATTSLAFAQDLGTQSYGAVSSWTPPQTWSSYGNDLRGTRAYGQPSPTTGIPGGDQPSPSYHSN